MTIHEFYETIDGDFDKVNLMFDNEELVKQFVIMFKKDDSFKEFFANYEATNYELAFRYIHSLKGVCLNLDFIKLADLASTITESLRNGGTFVEASLLEQLKKEYDKLISYINSVV